MQLPRTRTGRSGCLLVVGLLFLWAASVVIPLLLGWEVRIRSDFNRSDNPFSYADNPNPRHLLSTKSCSESGAVNPNPNPNPPDVIKQDTDAL